MNHFTVKGSISDIDISTGDEIEELAKCFNSMANNLKTYDDRQKAFLQNTSHELKTPLMSIQGYAEAIKDGVVQGAEVEPSLDIIIEESQRLKQVVEDIIYLTRLENFEDRFNFTRTNMKEIIAQAIQTIKPLMEEKNISINIGTGINFIGNFDKEKLIRAFINVLGNCTRYARSSILIQGKEIYGGVEIYIQDDGPGFKVGEADKIFDRFYKGDSGGTGLGLAIGQNIIVGHGGSIAAFNNNSGGAVFKIFIPCTGQI
jgi:signal transduction histidine kinase